MGPKGKLENLPKDVRYQLLKKLTCRVEHDEIVVRFEAEKEEGVLMNEESAVLPHQRPDQGGAEERHVAAVHVNLLEQGA